MTLTGEYTQAGAAISAQVLAGALTMQITRAAAGTGRTEASQTHLSDERQAMALSGGALEGSTFTIPAKLNSIEASGAYMLREIGLYAKNAGGTEVLYKIYRFDQPVSISPQCQLIATFYLNDTAISGSGVNVTVTPSGLVTAQDVESMFNSMSVMDSAATQISCTPAILQDTINSLPRIINSHTTITVSAGTLNGNLSVQNFTGVGSLTIIGPNGNPLIVTGYVDVFNCNLMYVLLQNITVNGSSLRPTNVRQYGSAAVNIRDCKLTLLELVTVKAPEAVSGIGFFIQRSQCTLGEMACPNRAYGVLAHMHSIVAIRSVSGQSTIGCPVFAQADVNCTFRLPLASSAFPSTFGSNMWVATASSTFYYSSTSSTSTGMAASNQ